MATVLSDDFQNVGKVVSQDKNLVIQRGKAHNQQIEPIGFSPDQSILVPILEGNESKTKELLQYASSLARRYSMKVTLVCAIPELDVPEGYVAYARAEGIGDYNYLYIESVSGVVLSKWQLFLENQGVKCDTFTYLGGMKDAVREAVKTRNIGLVIVRPEGSRKGIVNRILHPTFLGSIPFKASTESHTPVLVVS